MATRSMFFDAVSGDRSYDATSLAALLRALVQRDGVVYGYGGGLAVAATDPASMNVTVATGAAFVQGRMFEVHTSGETLAIGAADPTNPRIDRIVVKLDNSSAVRSVTLAVKAGTPAASPTPPTLQRDGTVWELSLAQVRVNAGVTSITSENITDERDNATVCGWTGTETAAISAFQAYNNATQAVAALTWTKVAYQVESYDYKSEYDAALYRFTATRDGLYMFFASVAFAAASVADGMNARLALYKNGGLNAIIAWTSFGAAKSGALFGDAPLKLTAGDYIEVYGWSDAATTIDTNAQAYARFNGVRVA